MVGKKPGPLLIYGDAAPNQPAKPLIKVRMTRPNPLILFWHHLTARNREASKRRRRNALRILEAAKRSGSERRDARRSAHPRNGESTEGTVTPGFSWEAVGRISLAVFVTVLFSALLCLHLLPNRVTLSLGDIATKDIIAQRTVRYEDTEATNQLRNAALSGVGRHYERIPDARQKATATTRSIFDSVGLWAAAGEVSGSNSHLPLARQIESALNDIHRNGATGVTKGSISYLMRLTPAERLNARSAAESVTARLMTRPIGDDNGDLEIARHTVPDDRDLATLFPDPTRRKVMAEVVSASLTPNNRFDALGTTNEQQAVQTAVPPQMRRATLGEVVIRTGERVTQQHLDAFKALGLQNSKMDPAAVAVICLLVAGMVTFVVAYLRLFHRRLYENTKQLVLLSILSVSAVIGLKIGSLLLGLPFSGVHFGYLGMMCVASAGMAIALLIDASVATLTVALLSIASGMILNNELRFTLLTLGSSLVGIVSVATLKNRSDYLRATLIVCLANVALNALVGQLGGDLPRELLAGVLWGGISGLFAMALFYTGVAVFERWFGITTHLRLLELSDPATPILQEFRLKVPGTYAHSLMVGTLGHAAAEAIGADSLLVRVAAYYHDLGKMNRPEFFIENQSGLENVHDRISPSLSALVLIAHVKDGVEMAKAMGLPPRVLELIEQHHGTTLMKFFYHKATNGIPSQVMEPQFRYPGPKPQTKESAILLLADSVEAASRSLEKPTPQRIADFVASIIEDKRADGQLDECDMTLWELKTVQETFARTLSGTLHARIAYPGEAKKVKPVPVSPLSELADLPDPEVTFPPTRPIVPVLTLTTFDSTEEETRETTEAPVLVSARRSRRVPPRSTR